MSAFLTDLLCVGTRASLDLIVEQLLVLCCFINGVSSWTSCLHSCSASCSTESSPVKRWRRHDFCEDFKAEINKVDEQRRFVITKGNDAG